MEQVPESSSGPLESNRPIYGVGSFKRAQLQQQWLMPTSWQLEPRAAISLGSNRHRHPSDWLTEVGAACEAAVFSPTGLLTLDANSVLPQAAGGTESIAFKQVCLSMCP